MKLLQSQNNRILLGAGAVLAIAIAAFLTLTSKRAKTERLVEEIYTTRSGAKVQRELKDINDRGLALEVLKEYLNQDDDNVDGKIEIVTLLLKWKEARVVHRAFTSGPLSAQRAVTALLYSSQRYHEEARAIALAWLRDANAPARYRAVTVVAQLKIKEALPDIEALLAKVPDSLQETLNFEADRIRTRPSIMSGTESSPLGQGRRTYSYGIWPVILPCTASDLSTAWRSGLPSHKPAEKPR